MIGDNHRFTRSPPNSAGPEPTQQGLLRGMRTRSRGQGLSARFSIAANVKPRLDHLIPPPSWASASLSRPMSSLALIISYRRRLGLRLTCHTGLSLLFEVGVRPPHDGMRRMGRSNLSGALPQISGRISGRYELTPPVVPVRTFFCRSRTR